MKKKPTLALLLLLPLLASCAQEEPASYGALEAKLLAAHPTEKYNYGTEITINLEDGTTVVFGTNFKQHSPIKIIEDKNLEESVFTCEELALEQPTFLSKSVWISDSSKGCQIKTPDASPYFQPILGSD